MENELEMEAQLWAYIDGLTDAPARSAIERLLAENEAWRNRYAELLETHALLQGSELDAPSLRFTRNVMEAIAGQQIVPAARQYLNNRVIGGIGILFGVLLLGALAFAFSQGGTDSGTAAPSYPAVNLDGLRGSGLFPALLLLQVLLALFLLDRVLRARRDRLHKQ